MITDLRHPVRATADYCYEYGVLTAVTAGAQKAPVDTSNKFYDFDPYKYSLRKCYRMCQKYRH